MYLTEFKSEKDVIESYQISESELQGADILLAWYGYGSYDGSSLVIFRRDGKLYEVHGSHCSCFGLEDNWSPEETTPEALLKQAEGMIVSSYSDGEKEAGEKLKELASCLS